MFNDVKLCYWVYLCIIVICLIYYYSWIDYIDKLILIEKNFFKVYFCVKMIYYLIKMCLIYFLYLNVVKICVIRFYD